MATSSLARFSTTLTDVTPVLHRAGLRGSPGGCGWTPFNRTEDPTTSDEMIARRALLEKSSATYTDAQ
jgi:hypothetical protein